MPRSAVSESNISLSQATFTPFTRESLQVIRNRKADEKGWKGKVADKRSEKDVRQASLHPDPRFEEGMPLPIRLAAQFEVDHIGVPLEDFDPYYRNQETFVLLNQRGDIYRFSATDAVWLLSPFNPLRRISIAILTHEAFSFAIIFTILVNCGMMLMPSSPLTESSEVIFTAIYTCEAAVKIMARGFILTKFTYLRDAWNWLDGIVVSLAYVTLFVHLGSLAVLRTFRVLRALKTVAIVPGLKTIVGAVIESVKNLRDVIILTVFSLSVFALMGLQLYMGVLTQKCIKTYPGNGSDYNVSSWHDWCNTPENWYIKNGTEYQLCGNATGAEKCPANHTCLAGFGPNPNYNYTSFDNFGWALLSAFRLMNQDSWENLYQQVLRCAGPWHITFFIVIIFLGSYYLINLILAIVSKSYDELQRKAFADIEADEVEVEALQAEAQADNSPKTANQSCKNSIQSKHLEEWESIEEQGKSVKSEDGNSYLGSYYGRLRLGFDEPSQASKSLPSSPFMKGFLSHQNLRRSNLPKKKILIMRSFIDAARHLPFADDSSGFTPTSFPSDFGSRHSSYNSHDNPERPLGIAVQVQPVLTPDKSIQKGKRRWSEVIERHLHEKVLDTADEPKNATPDKHKVDSPHWLSPAPLEPCPRTSRSPMKDLFTVTTKLREEENRRVSVFEQEEEGWRAVVKQKVTDGCFRFVELCCVWKCNILPWKVLQTVVAFIVNDPFFELFMTLAIICNTVLMSLDHHGLDEKIQLKNILDIGNDIFTTIFGLECVLKVMAMGPVMYSQSGWNVFDFLIVTISLIEISTENLKIPAIGALRSVRMLRVFKLAKSWPTLNLLISIMGKTLGGLGNLIFVLLIIVFIFAVMGKQLFGKNYIVHQEKFPDGDLPRWNFTDFGHSFMIIFRVLCGEWIDSMYDCMLVSGYGCVPFFLATVIIGNLVVLNLFLALLLNSFGAANLSSVTADPETNKVAEAFKRIGRFFQWIKGGIRELIRNVYRRTRRAINRTLIALSLKSPPPLTVPESKSKNRFGKTARLVLRSRSLTRQHTAEESFIMKPLDFHQHSRNRFRHTDETSLATTVEEDEEIEEVSEEANSRELQDVLADGDDIKTGDKLKMTMHSEKSVPNDCLPSTFYRKFPVFDVINPTWAKIRQHTFRLVENKYFQSGIVVMIVLSSLALAMEDKHLPDSPYLADILFYMDKIFMVVFFFEMIIKWVGLGFVGYFSNAWCWLDFTIVLLSVSNFIISHIPTVAEIPMFKAMRTLRALRPLRAMSRIQGMRIVVQSLIQAIPSIFNVLLVCLINWLVFAILGVQLFNGKFYKCIIPNNGSVADYRIVTNKTECCSQNLTWENADMNFDHVGKAYLCLFQVATFKGWIPIMNSATDSRGIDLQPHREISFYHYIYFVIFIILGSFFTLNLFVGVIIDNFNAQKKKVGGSMELFMTDDQKKYYSAMKKMGTKKPIKAIPRPNWKPQTMIFELVADKRFEMAIMALIALNMGIMTLDHDKKSENWKIALDKLNAVFVAVFTAECILKMCALRYYFFKDGWNLFDLTVVFFSVSSLMLDDLIAKYLVSPTLLRVVRMAKVGRILRLVKGARGIRTLLFALAMSLPALFNICLLLFLVMFIYAIFGMSFFMNVKLTAGLDEVYNFQTFGQSIILLFQMSTSAGWDSVLAGIMNEEDCEKPDKNLRLGDCGNAAIGIAYLLSYLVISFLIVINVYIAVILENYTRATEEVQEGLTDDDYDAFYEIWAQFDPQGTQYILYDQLTHFVNVLEPPLQIRKPNKYNIIAMDIPICKGEKVHCVDVLDALTRDFFERKGNVIEIDENLDITPVQITTDRPGYELTSSTLWRQREEYCARLIQQAWRIHMHIPLDDDRNGEYQPGPDHVRNP